MALTLAARLTLFLAPVGGVACTEGDEPATETVEAVEAVETVATAVPERARARARLTELRGDVQVKRASADDWAAGTNEMELYENDKVRTVAGASAKVAFENGSHVTVGENALVSIAETQTRPGEERSDLTVLEGRIDAVLPDADKHSLTVTTPTATVRAGREIVFQ